MFFCVALVLGACAPATVPGVGAPSDSAPARVKVLTAGTMTPVRAMSHAGPSTTSGGWLSFNEVHSNGLVTSADGSRQPVPRLAAELPSIDAGTIEVLPDGRMKVVYRLRTDVKWHDGTPFTANDLVFSQRVLSDRRLPSLDNTAAWLMERSEAPDDATFVIHFQYPYYEASVLGVKLFLPVPRHLMEPAYEAFLATGDPDAWWNHRYWSDDFVSTGPFRLAEFLPGELLVFERFDLYFLGRPKLDRIIVQTFRDANALLAGLLSGQVQLTMEALFVDLGLLLRERWEADGSGRAYFKLGTSRILMWQFRDGYQKEPANLVPAVRQALYRAIDRAAVVDAFMGGLRDLIPDSVLPPDHPLFPSAPDVFRRYPYDPERAKALLREQGWTPGPEGALRHISDGRRFQTSLLVGAGGYTEAAAYGAFWQQIGIGVEASEVPAAYARDEQFLASFPGWRVGGAGGGDRLFRRLERPRPGPLSGPGYDNPEADALRNTYIRAINPAEQATTVRAIGEFWARELPTLVLFYEANLVGARTEVRALHADWQGGTEASQAYGTFSRNAHLWDLD